MKLANQTIVLFNFANKIIFYKVFNQPILPINLITVFKLIYNFLNLNLSYCKLINMVKL